MDRYDPTHSHECDGSDSGYSSFEGAQRFEYSDTGYAIEGRGENVDPIPIPVGMPIPTS